MFNYHLKEELLTTKWLHCSKTIEHDMFLIIIDEPTALSNSTMLMSTLPSCKTNRIWEVLFGSKLLCLALG